MKLRIIILSLLLLLVAACTPDSPVEPGNSGFFKLYGNGTIQEAKGMEFSESGDIYILGNQYVRNEDSSAVVLFRINPDGNQVWSRRYFGKGFTDASSLLVLPSKEILILASSRESESGGGVPILFKVSEAGELLKEISLAEGISVEGNESYSPADMVIDESGMLYVVGNIRSPSGFSQKSFINKVDLIREEVIGRREFSDSEMTEVKKAFLVNSKLLLIGNTRQKIDELANQSMFLAAFSPYLIEAQYSAIGSSNQDIFKGALINSQNELVIISAEISPGSSVSKGVFRYLDLPNLWQKGLTNLEYSGNESPEAIAETSDGSYYIAINSFGERGRSNVMLCKTDPWGAPLWKAPREFGGQGSDKAVQIRAEGAYVFLLSTIDMQNENTLISLTKVLY